MSKVDEAMALRADGAAHYNCCQATLVPFCQCCGLSAETAQCLGSHFGSGMRCGSTCGAVTGALMALGAMGKDEKASQTLLRQFQQKNGALDCAHLLKLGVQAGMSRKDHCDQMVADAVTLVEQLMAQD